jgi:hypothetical protein
MPYIHPEEVISPRNRVRAVRVLHDPGENGMSVARILWDGEDVVAVRWNGNSVRPLGNPVSRRQPTWFVISDYAAAKVEEAAQIAAEASPNSLVARYRQMASDQEREREADEWSEGLIDDASAQR